MPFFSRHTDAPTWLTRALALLAGIGAVGVSVLELGTGLACRRLLHVEVWDYSQEWGNLAGLVCPKYTALWFLLCLWVLGMMRFLRGFATQLDTPFSQGHPVVLGQHRPIEELIQANRHRWRRTLAIEINYQIRDHQVQCDLLLLFTEDSIQFMNNKILHLM